MVLRSDESPIESDHASKVDFYMVLRSDEFELLTLQMTQFFTMEIALLARAGTSAEGCTILP